MSIDVYPVASDEDIVRVIGYRAQHSSSVRLRLELL